MLAAAITTLTIAINVQKISCMFCKQSGAQLMGAEFVCTYLLLPAVSKS
jgi:hypothetical protein